MRMEKAITFDQTIISPLILPGVTGRTDNVQCKGATRGSRPGYRLKTLCLDGTLTFFRIVELDA